MFSRGPHAQRGGTKWTAVYIVNFSKLLINDEEALPHAPGDNPSLPAYQCHDSTPK